MSAKTNYLENALINHVLRNVAFTSPSATYIALFTAVADGEAGTVTEVSGNGYARQLVNPNTTQPFWTAPANGVTDNDGEILFPVATGGPWGTITHIGVYDAVTAGNLLYFGALDASKQIDENDQFRIADGALTIAEA